MKRVLALFLGLLVLTQTVTAILILQCSCARILMMKLCFSQPLKII